MGASKKDFFHQNQNTIATLCNAFGHPARVLIIEYLLYNNQCICEELMEFIPLSRTTIWDHLKKLEKARLIRGRFKNNTHSFELDSPILEQVKSYFENINRL